MATENLTINSVKARNKKHALEKIVADVAINMTKANAQLKERHVQNATIVCLSKNPDKNK